MSLEAEAILERRRLRRRLGLWRILAILAVVAAIAVAALSRGSGFGRSGAQIARVAITGLITEDDHQLKLLDDIAKADNVKALVLRVNSPGGTTTGGEALYEAIRRVSEKKPVVAVFGTVAASAAYIAGIASDHIVARGNSITGSVGVIFQWAEVHDLLGKFGVKMNEVRSGDLKASPSMFRPTDEKSLALAEEMVAESHRWFIDLVKERRGVTEHDVPGLISGRIYSGREALRLKLVDSIGGERDGVLWLESKRDIAKDLPITTWKPKQGSNLGLIGLEGLWGGADAPLIDRIFGGDTASRLWRAVQLDGLVSVWHVPAKGKS